jgi:hypothetical protein
MVQSRVDGVDPEGVGFNVCQVLQIGRAGRVLCQGIDKFVTIGTTGPSEGLCSPKLTSRLVADQPTRKCHTNLDKPGP